jgi:Outer membrane protein beta-barrel domain
MLYINKGSLRVDTLTRTSFGFSLDYIEAPILVDFPLGILQDKMYAQIGPSVGFNIRQKQKSNGIFYEPNPAFQPLDIGITAGFSYHFNAKYQLHFRGSSSVLPVRPSPTVPIPNSYYLKGNYNQTMQLLFSMRF